MSYLAKALRAWLIDCTWMRHFTPPEAVQDTASSRDTLDGTSTETYRLRAVAKPYRVPATKLVLKRVKKRKRKDA